jgi:hypothetical protein
MPVTREVIWIGTSRSAAKACWDSSRVYWGCNLMDHAVSALVLLDGLATHHNPGNWGELGAIAGFTVLPP